MIEIMELEKLHKVRQVCVVTGSAHSMAFNILSHCDVRLSVPGTHMIVHQIAISGTINCQRVRCTSTFLKDLAESLDKDDEDFRLLNSKAMGLTLKEYDFYAGKEHSWVPRELIKRKYLHGIAIVDNA